MIRSSQAVASPAVILGLYDYVKPARKWNVVGDNVSDNTVNLNQMFTDLDAEGPGRKASLPPGSIRISDTLRTLGTGIVGSDTGVTSILPTAAFPINSNYIEVTNPAGEFFLTYENFTVIPRSAGAGTEKGKKVFVLQSSAAVNVPLAKFSRLYFAAGNDWSIDLIGGVAQTQGYPAISAFEDLVLYSGFRANNLGDSVRWIGGNNRSNSAASRCGWDITFVAGGGSTAAAPLFLNTNGGGLGTIMRLRNGRNIRIINPNYELGNDNGSTGGANSCVIDLDGSVSTLIAPVIEGGLIGIFGDSTANSLIRVGDCYRARIGGDVTLLSGKHSVTNAPALAQLITVSASAKETNIEKYQTTPKISTSPPGTTWTAAVTDAGAGTTGVPKALTPATHFTNLGSGFATLGCVKREKTVYLTGVLAPDSSVATGQTITTLPAGQRPIGAAIRLYSSSANLTVPIDIATTGVVTYQGPAGPSQPAVISLCGLCFDVEPSNEIP